MDFSKFNARQREVAEKVKAAAEKYGVPVELALGLAMQESSMGLNMDGGKGPKGVMMIGNKLAKDEGIDQLNDDQNIDVGVRYLKRQLDKTGNIDDALVAYHDGPDSSYFKGGEMSPAAAQHVEKVKGYMNMAQDKDIPAAESFELEPIYTGEMGLDDSTLSDTSPIIDRRTRGADDLVAGGVGAVLGGPVYGTLGEHMSNKRAEKMMEARRLALSELETKMRLQEAIRRQFEQSGAPVKATGFGSALQNWSVTQFPELINAQLRDPLTETLAEAEAEKIANTELRARKKFPNQVPVAPGSLLTIDAGVGSGRPPANPAPSVAQRALPQGQPGAGSAPVQMPRIEDTQGYKIEQGLKARAPKTNAVLGGLAAAQGYDAYQNLRQGNLGAAAESGLGALAALFGTAAKKPWMKALMGVGSAASMWVPEIKQALGFGEQPAPPPAPVQQKAAGGVVQPTAEDIARMRMQRAMMQRAMMQRHLR